MPVYVWASFGGTGDAESELVADGPAPDEGNYFFARHQGDGVVGPFDGVYPSPFG